MIAAKTQRFFSTILVARGGKGETYCVEERLMESELIRSDLRYEGSSVAVSPIAMVDDLSLR